MNTTGRRIQGRDNEYNSLKLQIEDFTKSGPSQPNLTMISISGAGGIGKTYLLDALLSDLEGRLSETLIIKIGLGSNEQDLLKDFTLLIDQKLAPIQLACGDNPKNDYFPATRSLVSKQMELRGMVDQEIAKDPELDEHVKKMAKGLYKLGPWFKHIPEYGSKVAFVLKVMEETKAEEYVKPAIEALGSLNALREKSGLFSNPLKKRRFSTLRRNPGEAFAESYLSDLSALLSGYQRKDLLRPTHGRLKSRNRYLLIIDDYEATELVIGRFLLSNLLEKLQSAHFPTLIVFVGRDSIIDVDPDYQRRFANDIAQPLIQLQPFSESDSVQYLKDAGYGEDEAVRWCDRSQGIPFILDLIAQHRTDDERSSAAFFKRFYDRTTCWMTHQERDWLTPLCYLDNVNVGTIRKMLPDENAEAVFQWFVKNSSIRDTRSTAFVVMPYVRYMLLEYNSKRIGEVAHGNLVDKAKQTLEEVNPEMAKQKKKANSMGIFARFINFVRKQFP